MGTDKGLVALAGKPLVQHIVDRLDGLADEVLITTNKPDAYAAFGVLTAPDADPGAGALAGLLTALDAARGEVVLVVACDMPFVSRRLAEHMLRLAIDAEAVVPKDGEEFEPLFAVYRRACIEPIRRALDAGQRRVISFFPDVRLRVVDVDEARSIEPDDESFFNVNTPADLAEAERRLRGDRFRQP
jgi:molybdopterin-guanine dinucleotide biosynthesis protein A